MRAIGCRFRPAGLAFACPVLLGACGAGSAEVTGCSGFADKVAITRDEYGPCAQEILSALDTLQVRLRELIRGDAGNQSRDEAREALGHLEVLWRQAGLWNPRLPASAVEIWPDSEVRSFNSHSKMAYSRYKLTLRYLIRPPDVHFNIHDEFNEGSRLQADAANVYRRTW